MKNSIEYPKKSNYTEEQIKPHSINLNQGTSWNVQFLLEKASTPIEIEERFTAMESQEMNVRSLAKKTLGSI